MSGTIVIDAATCIDVRTVDFLQIVAALRAARDAGPAIGRLLASVDEAGINMLCADELDAAERASFAAVLDDLRRTLGDDDGFKGVLADLVASIGRDERPGPRTCGA